MEAPSAAADWRVVRLGGSGPQSEHSQSSWRIPVPAQAQQRSGARAVCRSSRGPHPGRLVAVSLRALSCRNRHVGVHSGPQWPGWHCRSWTLHLVCLALAVTRLSNLGWSALVRCPWLDLTKMMQGAPCGPACPHLRGPVVILAICCRVECAHLMLREASHQISDPL